MLQGTKRDSWGSKWGFILACIGSAVGMGNIWLFPARVSAYGGATFLIPYLIFVVIIGSTGVIGEMSFGRATRSGPVHAFGEATRMRFGSDRPGKLLGLIPVLGSLALAIGYSVVTGWIFKYTFQSFTGSLSQMQGVAAFDANFGATAGGNIFWQLVGMAVTVVIMAFGIGRGIEKANKVMTPCSICCSSGWPSIWPPSPGPLRATGTFSSSSPRACWTLWYGSLPWGRRFSPCPSRATGR